MIPKVVCLCEEMVRARQITSPAGSAVGKQTRQLVAPQMNCWQAVLMSAYYGGLVTKEQLVELHEPNAGETNMDKSLLDKLGRNTTDPIDETSAPPAPGDIILMDHIDDVGFHVFIAGEDDMAYSHDMGGSNKFAADGPSEDGKVYNYSDQNASESGARTDMVYMEREKVIRHTRDGYLNLHENDIEIRYLSPSVFKKRPKKDAEPPFG